MLAGLLAACGEDEDAGTSEAATAAPATSAASTADQAESTGDAAATSEPSSPSESEATAAGTDATAPASTEPVGSTEATAGRPVAIYLVRNERVSPVRRYVDPAAPATPTLEALLAGPMDGDGDRTTAIPDGTSLLGVSIDGDGILTADLSQEFTSGGGSLSMKLRAAQIVYTATQFPTVKGVLFAVEGEPVETLGGEGLTVDRPQTRADYEDETPAVLIEEPLPGDTPQLPGARPRHVERLRGHEPDGDRRAGRADLDARRPDRGHRDERHGHARDVRRRGAVPGRPDGPGREPGLVVGVGQGRLSAGRRGHPHPPASVVGLRACVTIAALSGTKSARSGTAPSNTCSIRSSHGSDRNDYRHRA